MNRNETVVLLTGGTSLEREISLKSGKAVARALNTIGCNTVQIDIRDGFKNLLSGEYDSAFIALHGSHGEDGSIQGMLEIMGLPYTGSGVLASAATMDKAFSKMVMKANGIKTPDFRSFTSIDEVSSEQTELDFSYPVMVKPVSQGSTIGISRVNDKTELSRAVNEAFSYGGDVMVERFIDGREVTVSILNGKALPVVEVFPESGFYDYDAKYISGRTKYAAPADIPEYEAEELCSIAVEIYRLFGCRGAARVDFMLDVNGPQALEINTIPGMTETSLLPMAAEAAGISFECLVEKMLLAADLDGRLPKKADLVSAGKMAR